MSANDQKLHPILESHENTYILSSLLIICENAFSSKKTSFYKRPVAAEASVAAAVAVTAAGGAVEDGPEAAAIEEHELELELIQSHVAQKPVLRGEVGCACVAREVSIE